MNKISVTQGKYERNDAGVYEKVGTDIYTFWIENSRIYVEHENVTRSMNVVENDEFIYKLLKTQIKAIDGAKGLFSFMMHEVENDKDYAVSICKWIVTNGK